MGREQIEVVRRSLDAWNRGDVDAMVAEAAPDSEYAISELNPNARLLRGREEIADYLRDWHDTVYGLHYDEEPQDHFIATPGHDGAQLQPELIERAD